MKNNILITIGVLCFILFCILFTRYTNQQSSVKLKEKLDKEESFYVEKFSNLIT